MEPMGKKTMNTWTRRMLAAAACVSGLAGHAATAAETAVMIEAGDQALREDIQWLIDRRIIDLTTSTWPLPLAALEDALARRVPGALSPADQVALRNVERIVARHGQSGYGLVAGLNTDKAPVLGFASQPRAQASGGAYLQSGSGAIAGKLQVNALANPLTAKQASGNLEGSYVAASFLGQVAYAGALNHWWGPGMDGSVNWGNAATPIPGIGLQRAQQRASSSPWLSWIGPWGYNVFAGQLQHDTAVPGTRIFNMRVFVRPLPGLELGASRFIEWGGAGRPSGLGTFWKAVTGNSNEIKPDPSNELSGFDARYSMLVFGNPLAVYGQLAGEDEAGHLPSKYIALTGVQFKHLVGTTRLQWHAEVADTMVRRLYGRAAGDPGVAYAHSTYRNGLYQDGLPLGYPIGGDGRMTTVGLSVVPDDTRHFSRYGARLLHADVNPLNQAINQAFPHKNRWTGAEFTVDWVIRPVTLRGGLVYLHSHDPAIHDVASLMVTANIPLSKL